MHINGHKVGEGTVIHATLRHEDLIPAFCDEIRRLTTRTPDIVYEAEMFLQGDHEQSGQDDIAVEIVHELVDQLNDIAPEGYYFGAHEGDGSDFGFNVYQKDHKWFVHFRDKDIPFIGERITLKRNGPI